MPDILKEGNLPEQGASETANPGVSAQGNQPSEVDLAALAKRLDSLERENRSLQSGKDKRWNEVMPIVEKVAKILGVDEKDVQEATRKIALDELVAERFATPQPSAESLGGDSGRQSPMEVTAVAKALGLNPADTDVASVLFGVSAVEEKIALLGKLAVSKATKPKPTEAQSPAPQGGSTPGTEDTAKWEAELDVLYVHPTLNAAKIAELEKKLGWT